jgi:hypothetical protein
MGAEPGRKTVDESTPSKAHGKVVVLTRLSAVSGQETTLEIVPELPGKATSHDPATELVVVRLGRSG